MIRLFAWADSPNAPTGFGRSAKHVLEALEATGRFEIHQLAVNQDPSLVQEIPWKVYMPVDRNADPYGLAILPEIIERVRPDMLWTTFDPEVPWRYQVPGATRGDGKPVNALDYILSLRDRNPGFKAAGWFPIDGGPLSNFEMAVMCAGPAFDFVATMANHVHGLIEWTLKLKGFQPNAEEIYERVHVIPHAVDADLYPCASDEERADAKRRLGFPDDVMVVAQVERNQQRKQNYLGLEVMESLFKRRPEARGKVVLYQHMLPDEENQGCRLGFNLPELAWRYGLKAGVDVRWPKDFIPAEEMPLVYRAADVFLSTSTGEGFQYPAWEALATGTPIVVPDNSARGAWFKSAPLATLYQNDDRRLVMRGGYHRRMAMADPAAAAQAIHRVLFKKPPTQAQREAAAMWVQRHARLEDVQHAWVQAMERLADDLIEERKAAQIATEEDMGSDTVTVTMGASPGLGDLCLAAPALNVLRQNRRVNLAVPGSHLHLAKLLNLADVYETKPTPGASEVIHIEDLYQHGHRDGWGDPKVHRSDVIARHLGVNPADMRTTMAFLPENVQEQVRNQFTGRFGVDPTNCVAIALESANPHRAMPKGYIPQLEQRIKAMGLTPVVVGRERLNIERVGTVNLTGQTDLPTLFCILEQVGAVISTDSGTAHFAGIVGTPLVACFTLFPPESRLTYYAGWATGDIIGLCAKGPVEGEDFPAGAGTKVTPGAWASTITVGEIMAALAKVLGQEAAEPTLIRPGGVHEMVAS